MPVQAIEFAREDIASVSTRHVVISRSNDQQVRIPANGFTLAGTVSLPVGGSGAPSSGRRPGERIRSGRSRPRPWRASQSWASLQAAWLMRVSSYCVTTSAELGKAADGRKRPACPSAPRTFGRLSLSGKAQGDVDEKRIAAAGHSEGGSACVTGRCQRSPNRRNRLDGCPRRPRRSGNSWRSSNAS